MQKINGIINSYINKIYESIFSNRIFIILLMVPFFKTSGYLAIPYLNDIINVILVIECVFFLASNIFSEKTSMFCFLVILYGTWTYFIAPIFNPSNQPPSFYYITCFLGIISFLEAAISTNYKKTIDGISFVFTIMIVLNLILSFIFPDGIVSGVNETIFLFGLRTGFSLVIFPGIMFCLLYDELCVNKKISYRTTICACASLISLLSQWVVTGIIQFIIIIFLYFAVKLKWIRKHINVIVCFLSIIILNFCIVVFGFDNIVFRNIFEWLNKDITLTGRTYIWENAIEKIKLSPIFGLGIDSLVDIYGYMKPAHNQWLHVALESGVVGLLMLLVTFLMSCIKLNKYKGQNFYYIITIFIFVILIGTIVEVQFYLPFMFAIFELPYLAKYFTKNNDIEKNIKGCVNNESDV